MSTEQNGSKAGTPSPERLGSVDHRAQLWDAINDYAIACGGTPGTLIYGNVKRQQAVAEIEALVYSPNTGSHRPSEPEANEGSVGRFVGETIGG